MKKFTEDNIREIINKEFELNGYTERYNDLVNISGWWDKFTTTPEKEKEWLDFVRMYLKPYTSKARTEKEAGWILLSY